MQTQKTQATIEWSNGVIPWVKKDGAKNSLDKNGFYALLGGKKHPITGNWVILKLLYIGQAYEQSINDRLDQAHTAYVCINDYLQKNQGCEALITTGIIKSCSQERYTQELFNDIEACLIRSNKPHCNTQSKYSYGGRTIEITNTGGFSPLLQTCSCSD